MPKLPETVQEWVGVIYQIALLAAGAIAAVFAYSRYIVERGLLPAAQFEIELGAVGHQQGKLLIEILLHLRNIGSATLVLKNLRIDIRYIEKKDKPVLFQKGHANAGRLIFPTSALKEFARPSDESTKSGGSDSDRSDPKKHTQGTEERGIVVVGHNTFVQPGVNRTYTFVTSLPEFAAYILIWSSFEYEPRLRLMQRPILFVSRRLGLIQYSLGHVRRGHTCERMFEVESKKKGETEGGNI
jgi:hypothetical protein